MGGEEVYEVRERMGIRKSMGRKGGGGLNRKVEHPRERCAPGVVNMQVAYF